MGIPLLTACSAVADGEHDHESPSTVSTGNQSFINLTIAVSGGKDNTTRAGEKPTAGEDGDGREAGFPHEDAVTGITLILYQGSGINDVATTAIDFVAYYPVSKTTKDTDDKIEATYETGKQLLDQSKVDLTKTYHAIVVANADLRGAISTSSTLGQVRNHIIRTLYSGNEKTQPARDCANFVMSSENDYTVTFDSYTTIPEGRLYSFEGLRIERMTARIDFWAAGATYDDVHKGYAYDAGTADKFVVTGLMPFNLMGANSTNGGEYLIKRVATSPTSTDYTYLGNEGSNFVIDPAILVKTTSGELTYYKNKVLDFGTLAGHATYSGANDYYRSTENLHAAIVTTSPASGGYTALTDGALTGEDVVLCYPMENTLQTSSYLYSFATGIVIEGDYYQGGFSGTKTHRIYYGYLRHEGTAASYQARLGAAFELDKASALPPASPMEYGIVRNNIYRIYISSITSESMILSLKVKKWDPYTHDWIYM